jgi:hypothetical protein
MGRSATAGREAVGHRARTPAQWYCLLVGLVLLAVGVLGFISDSSFETGDAVQGDSFLGFEVNGIHNLVHVASGLVLLAASPKRASARAVALAFGLVYGLVAIIGLVDTEDVLGLLPVNAADNILHVALAALGIATGLISRGDDRGAGTLEGGADDRRFGHDEPAGARTAPPTGGR